LLPFIFLNKGGTIQGSTKARDISHFASIINKGDNLKIKGFYTFENCYINIVVNHETIIDLKFDTKVTRLVSLPFPIPWYYFNFTNSTYVFTKEKWS
jgi:replication factor A1